MIIMDKNLNNIKLAFAGICLLVVNFLGGRDMMLEVLFTFTVLDIVTGVVLAASTRSVSSDAALHGFVKKIGMYIMVGVAVSLDRLLDTEAGMLRTATIGFFIAVEGISIVENWGAFGLPMPQKLREVLKQLQE